MENLIKQMRAIALLVVSGVGFARSPLLSQSALPTPLDSIPIHIYQASNHVSTPELLSNDFSTSTLDKCKEKKTGRIGLSLIVDSSGIPRNIMFTKPLGNDLDKFALAIVGMEHFKPGQMRGTPVPVALSLEVGLDGCIETETNSEGLSTARLRLRNPPVQKFDRWADAPSEAILAPTPGPDELLNLPKGDGGVSRPIPIKAAAPDYTEEARRARFQGVSLVTLIVDSQGMPKNVRVVRPIGLGLDEKAIEAVLRYRFKPAIKNGEPLPNRISIEVNFRLY